MSSWAVLVVLTAKRDRFPVRAFLSYAAHADVGSFRRARLLAKAYTTQVWGQEGPA